MSKLKEGSDVHYKYPVAYAVYNSLVNQAIIYFGTLDEAEKYKRTMIRKNPKLVRYLYIYKEDRKDVLATLEMKQQCLVPQ